MYVLEATQRKEKNYLNFSRKKFCSEWIRRHARIKKVNAKLRSVICHTGSHSVTCHPTQVNVPRLKHQPVRQVLDLATPEGWQAELILETLTSQLSRDQATSSEDGLVGSTCSG